MHVLSGSLRIRLGWLVCWLVDASNDARDNRALQQCGARESRQRDQSDEGAKLRRANLEADQITQRQQSTMKSFSTL